MIVLRRFAVIPIILLCLLVPVVAHPMDLALIVHPDNKTNDLSSRDLSRIFKQEKKHWPDHQKILLIMQEDGTFEKNVFVKKVYKLSPNELKRFWLAKILDGQILSFPKTLGSSEVIKRFVSQIPSAIAYVDVTVVDSSIKVLSIDGKRPGDAGYYLSHE